MAVRSPPSETVPVPTPRLFAIALVLNPAANRSRINSRIFRTDSLSAAINSLLEEAGKAAAVSGVNALPGLLGSSAEGAHLGRNACSASPEWVLTLPGTTARHARNGCSPWPGTTAHLGPESVLGIARNTQGREAEGGGAWSARGGRE